MEWGGETKFLLIPTPPSTNLFSPCPPHAPAYPVMLWGTKVWPSWRSGSRSWARCSP